MSFEELEPWDAPVNIEPIANQIENLLVTHCVMTDQERVATTLWIISSYCNNSFRIFPRLTVISPERRCGKSTLLEVIEAVTKNALLTSNLSTAVLYRLTETTKPTLIIDEADTFIKNSDPQMKGVLNGGHNKSQAKVLRCEGDNHTVKVYDAWFPIVLASIGTLYDTIMDRSITINLIRKKPSESVMPPPQDLKAESLEIRQKILKWANDESTNIESNIHRPAYKGNDRATDNWTPLFTIAREISEHWFNKCEHAYHLLMHEVEMELPTLLLSDIRESFKKWKSERISSSELLNLIKQDETAPWESERLTAAKMASTLKPYGIKPSDIRFGKKVLRGYSQSQFTDAFERYLPRAPY
ncbi:DUF3631 domain-containing protein [Neptunomonas phycophila]|uniref:DUF3631 domain-containing protein n=1 Tax=Neptunomonas phycophila TaxID=1572645 RepID=A0ABT9EYD0_9GAMM|nr:DUF3631 domain-containing protein [Neptunomonas phycophila]MDP2523957.1 DUF3631 domain-containing protein [Neptunomonas phycophila]